VRKLRRATASQNRLVCLYLDMTHSEGPVAHPEVVTLVEYRSLASIWRALSKGVLLVRAISAIGPNSIVVLTEQTREATEGSATLSSCHTVFERMLDGTSPKVIADEFALSLPTISMRFSAAAKRLGLPSRVAAVPMCIAELRCADRLNSSATAAVYRIEDGGSRDLYLILPRANAELAQTLSPAELEVCLLFLDGLSHRQIADYRHTSVRTTANQLAAVFRRLKVSGRLELLAHVALDCVKESTRSHGCVDLQSLLLSARAGFEHVGSRPHVANNLEPHEVGVLSLYPERETSDVPLITLARKGAHGRAALARYSLR